MILPEITKFPVFMLISARTGSTAFAGAIAKHYDLVHYGEPESLPDRVERIQQFSEFSKNSNRYLLKTNTFNMYTYYPRSLIDYYLTSDEVYKIRLRRRDRVAQMASNYIARHRKIWVYRDNQTYSISNTVEIVESDMDRDISIINNCYRLYDNMDVKFDCDVYYEDLGFVDNTDVLETPRPDNYDEIVDTFKRRIKLWQRD
jgi:hypothetical protein